MKEKKGLSFCCWPEEVFPFIKSSDMPLLIVKIFLQLNSITQGKKEGYFLGYARVCAEFKAESELLITMQGMLSRKLDVAWYSALVTDWLCCNLLLLYKCDMYISFIFFLLGVPFETSNFLWINSKYLLARNDYWKNTYMTGMNVIVFFSHLTTNSNNVSITHRPYSNEPHVSSNVASKTLAIS